MKALKVVVIIVVSLVALAVALLFLIGYFKPKLAGIYIEANPKANVYIDNKLVGKTPYKGSYPPGQINLRMEPETKDSGLIGYETKLGLTSGIETVVRREFGKDEDSSSGDVITFDKTGSDKSGLVIVSIPDNSQVSIDGIDQGFTPYNLSSVVMGDHEVIVKASGFLSRNMNVRTQKGHRLTIFVKLAKSNETPSNSQEENDEKGVVKTYVVIDDTPTGFLRMRTKPGTDGDEIAELKPGERYLFLEEDTSSKWLKIQYKDAAPGLPNGIVGWVSNQYAHIATESGVIN